MITLFEDPQNTWELVANGLPWTLTLAFSSLAIGFVLAVLLALARLSSIAPLRWFAYAYVYLFRSTPLLVQIFPNLLRACPVRRGSAKRVLAVPARSVLVRHPVLTLNTTAYSSEIIRGGLQSVPWGQVEAAKACGMSTWLRFKRVVFPKPSGKRCPATAMRSS